MQLIHLNETTSTNSYLRHLLQQEPQLPEYTMVECYSQTAGRGQRGNSWESQPGQNLTCSILLRPTLPQVATTFDLNIIVSLALRELLTQWISPERIKVKWPNDLMVDHRKIAGILIENEWSGAQWDYAIVGIGLNVHQTHFAHYHPQATSISLESHTPISQEEWVPPMLQKLTQLLQHYTQLLHHSIDALRQEYHRHLLGYQQTQLYQLPTGEIIAGTIQSVHPNGLLQIATSQGTHTYAFKEIHWIGNLA